MKKCERQEHNPRAPKFEEGTQDVTLQQEATAEKHGTWRRMSACSQNTDKVTFLSDRSQGNARAHFENSRGTRIRG